MKVIHPTRFDLSQDDIAAFRHHLESRGYAVVRNVVENQEEIDRISSMFWSWMESVPGTAVKRDDPSTWIDKKDWIPSPGNGIVSGFGFNHSDFCWSVRMLPKVKAAFSAVWDDEDDLLVSFDGGNAFRPWNNTYLQKNLKANIAKDWKTNAGWWHMDQNPRRPNHRGKACVQGLVSMTDATERTGGLCIVPGSHLEHDAVCARSELSCGPMPMDFVPVDEHDPILRTAENEPSLICCQAGDLILWDSRTVHCNTPGTEAPILPEEDTTVEPGISDGDFASSSSIPLLRLACYVCMTPRKMASQEVLARRQEAYEQSFGTNHWPHEFHSRVAPLPGQPRRDPQQAPREVRCLVGYADDEVQPNGDASHRDESERGCSVS